MYASKEVGLEVNAEKTKYRLLPCHQIAGQNLDMKRANKSFENVAQFKYVYGNDGNKSIFDSGNNCYHAVQKHLSSHLLCKIVKI
jgi:hypothetical protein